MDWRQNSDCIEMRHNEACMYVEGARSDGG